MQTLRYVLFSLLAVSVPLMAQTPAQDSSHQYGWKHSLVTALTLTQVTYTDWVQGGENALAYTLSAEGKSVDELDMSNWTTTYRFAFGQTRLGDQGLRKTDDIIDIATVLTYKLGSYINPYVAATLKTQFAHGYAYPAPDSSMEVSAFFDPAYLTQTVGVGYQPIKEVKTRLGIGLREIITNQFYQYADDPTTTEHEKTSVDGGFESVTNADWQLADNILMTTQLEFFAPVKHLDEVVVRDNTTFTGKISKYVTAVFDLQLINEERVSPRTQVKETIALGMSYAIF